MAQHPHEPDERSRAVVKTAAGYGLPHEMICTLVGVSKKTLYIYYRDELDLGKAQATFEVAKTLYHRATVGKDLGAAIFWLKAQAGWREKHVLDDPNAKTGLLELIGLSGLKVVSDEEPAAYVEPGKPETRQ